MCSKQEGEVPCCLGCQNDTLRKKLARAMRAIKKLRRTNRKLRNKLKINIVKLKIFKYKNGILKMERRHFSLMSYKNEIDSRPSHKL